VTIFENNKLFARSLMKEIDCVGIMRELLFRLNKILLYCCLSMLVATLSSCERMLSSHSRQIMSPWLHSISYSGSGYAWVSTNSGEIYRTTNGGDTWKKISLKMDNKAEKVYFLNSYLGWMINHKWEVWKTIDGGDSWTLIAKLKNTIEDKYILPVNAFWFIEPSRGWILDSGSIWRTEDSEQNWKAYQPAFSSQRIGELIYCGIFATPKTGWLGGGHGLMYITSDGGKTWGSKELGSAETSFIDTGTIDSSHGWLLATNGTLYVTKDQGKNWAMQSDVLDDNRHFMLSAS